MCFDTWKKAPNVLRILLNHTFIWLSQIDTLSLAKLVPNDMLQTLFHSSPKCSIPQ